MPRITTSNNLQKETLRRVQGNTRFSSKQRRLAELKADYSELHRLLTGNVNGLVNLHRIYPTYYPAQASGRWSVQNPAITNWPRACINQQCPHGEHEWTDVCWSVRDILLADEDEVLSVHDHDNIEGRIHDLILDHKDNIRAHADGYDLHTITCCKMFNMDYPLDLKNPHTSLLDASWRAKYNWQGKDTRIRVLAKNMNHGWKYTRTHKFVHKIKGIEQFGISYDELEDLAKVFIAENQDVWNRKLIMMDQIRKDRVSYTLYGFRRMFYDSSEETGREGFSHKISGTVSDYNNKTILLMEKEYGKDQALLHNAHDGDKFVFKRSMIIERYGEDFKDAFKADLSRIIERTLEYEGRSLVMTAGIKIYA